MSTQLISSFQRTHSVIQDSIPLSDDRILRVVPSIFAEAPHGSRSERYTYIPTSQVLAGLRQEGFQPFFACQTRVRLPERADFTKHMIRLRHTSRINGAEANEIILVNSHDGSSAYQMLAGVFRFVCTNGMVCGDEVEDFRVPHRGDVVGQVIEGAYRILDEFERIDAAKDGMRAVELRPAEQRAFARAALALRFEGNAPPVTEGQALEARRHDDQGDDLWRVFNRIQDV